MIKKLYIIGILLMALFALNVSAADLTLSTTSLSTPATRPTESFSVGFSVNNATENLAGLTLSSSGLSDFSINFTINGVQTTSLSLNTSETKNILVNGKIPKNVNTRQSPFSGAISISGSGISKSIPLSVNAEGQLEFDNVKSVVDGKSKSLDDGDTIKDVLPGSKVEIKGDVLNTYTRDQDIVIEDVTVTITIEKIDDDEDLEEEIDVGDIDADDKESFKYTFDIPEDVEDGDYDVTILVEGEDENGAKHAVEWKNIVLAVEKDKHDIWITKATLSPAKVSCSRNINMNIELKNQGTSDEDEVVLRIESADLEINFEDNTIEELQEGAYDEDTEHSATYSFQISDKVKAGTYAVNVKAYYNTDTLSDTERLDLVVENCAVEEETTPEDVVVVTPPTTGGEDEPEIITEPVTETTEGSVFGASYLTFLVGAIILAVIVVMIMVVVLLSMKKKA